ncbi:MAG: hypothetical protein AB1916_13190 [Thermodesulfobacteriota bacterium]
MVVEDERIIALATGRMVTRMWREECACAHSGEKALEELDFVPKPLDQDRLEAILQRLVRA